MIAQFPFSKEYAEIETSNARYVHLWGGRGRGGSYTATQYALRELVKDEYFRCYIMRQVQRDIKDSLFKDVKDRIEENPALDESMFNISDHSCTIINPKNKNEILSKGFVGSNNRTAKLKSLAGASCVIIEEAEEVSEEQFMQLDDSLRKEGVKVTVFLIFNPPPKGHWIIKRWYNLTESKHKGYYVATPKSDDNLLSIFSTYKNNRKNLNPTTLSNYERYKETNPEYYYTTILGLVSEGKKGRIFRDWQPITLEEYNDLEYNESLGLDFGFSADPTAVAGVKRHNNNVYIRQYIYDRELTNPAIKSRLDNLGVSHLTITADSAEPKSIKELKNLGLNIKGATKGSDSIRAGIDYMKTLNFYLVEDSRDFWIEVENYCWALDANKEPTNKPIDDYNHLMDALRYDLYTNHAKPKLSGGLSPI